MNKDSKQVSTIRSRCTTSRMILEKEKEKETIVSHEHFAILNVFTSLYIRNKRHHVSTRARIVENNTAIPCRWISTLRIHS